MEGIDQWAAVIAVCSVIVCITDLLISDDKNRRIVKAVLGCFLISAAIKPLLSFTSQLKLSVPDTEYYQEADASGLEELEHQMIDSRLEAEAQRIFDEKSLPYSSIDISVGYDDEGKASSLSCVVNISDKDRSRVTEIKSAVNESFGIEPRIIIASEG